MINVQSKLIIYILFKLIDYILYTPLFSGNIGFFFTLPVMNSDTKRLSLVSTQIPHGFCNLQLSMQRRNIPSWSKMWIGLLSRSDVRIILLLSVVMLYGMNNMLVVGGPVYVDRSFPAWLTPLLHEDQYLTHRYIGSSFHWWI